ncbi:MAG: cyclase family protein [Bacteroidales bacterium]|nr:cyclase family protein [Bacteroidales bacterium]
MQIIDLSHEISEQMTVFGEMEKPEITRKYTVKKDGFKLHELKINSHTGTHVDAPAHMIADRKNLDDFALNQFYGKGFILKVDQFAKSEIPLDFLKKHENQIRDTEFLILNSGWYKKWKTADYQINYPVLSQESAQWLTQFQLKGIGLDYISIDPTDSQDVPLHKIILGADFIIIENLTNLDTLQKSDFQFQCFPLKVNQADGSTSRAVAFV